MLKSLVSFSIRYRGVVIALACITFAYELYVATHAKLDVFPEFAPPQVTIQTEAPGLSPEEVEALVTRPVENAVNGVRDLEAIRSQSIQGLSVIVATFRDDTDLLRARQVVGERLVEAAGRLPDGVEPPTMAPPTSSTSLVLVVGLTSEQRTPMELRTFADWTLRPRLLGVPGVANVVEFGGEVRQIQVQVQPERLQAFDLDIDDVLSAARGSTGVRGAGFVETDAQRIVIRTEGQPLGAAELGEVVVAQRQGASVRLRDVARVVDGAEPKLGDAAVMGHPGVLLLVWSQYGANTLQVTEAVERALHELEAAFASQEIAVYPKLFRPADFITSSVHNVNTALLMGGFLVMVVLFLFLLDLRTAFISFTSIPLSLLAAVAVLDHLGVSLNTITLGGLAIAIGVVVDDAIIGVENITRRLRENRALETPRPLFQVVLDATLEVRSPVVYATFIVALVFLPVLTMSGVQGRLFAPLAQSFLLANLASLVVALTVTPALCYAMLARARSTGEPPYIRALKRVHLQALGTLGRRPGLVLGAASTLCLGAALVLPFFGGTFLPEFREGHFIVQMTALPGTSAHESLRIGQRVALEMLENPHVGSVSQQVGRAELGEDTAGTDFSEFIVAVRRPGAKEAEFVQNELRQTLARFPGMHFAVKTFLAERIEETISGATAELLVKLYGDDLDVIDAKAQEIAAVLSGIPGAADVQMQSPPGEPQMVVRLRPERLLQFGFRPLQVLEAVQTAYQGTVVAQAYEGDRVYDVAVVLDAAARRDPESIAGLLLRSPEGARVPLGTLADVGLTTGRHMVLHDGARRYQAVTCNARGRDLEGFAAEARRRIATQVKLPAGVYTVLTGAAEAQAQARRDLVLHAGIAAAGIVLLLAMVFGSLRHLGLVLANLPFALVGGVLAVFLTGGRISVGSLVGFVTLFGITMRNSILMVAHFEHLVRDERMTWGPAVALRGASERLLPILMTALVTALGLLPLAVDNRKPGREIEGPMAIVIVGGLVTSTLLNLLVLPTLALRYGRFEAGRHDPEAGA